MVLEVMCSQGNLAFTYGGVGRDQIQCGSTVEDERIKLVLRFIRTLQVYIWCMVKGSHASLTFF